MILGCISLAKNLIDIYKRFLTCLEVDSFPEAVYTSLLDKTEPGEKSSLQEPLESPDSRHVIVVIHSLQYNLKKDIHSVIYNKAEKTLRLTLIPPSVSLYGSLPS
jgi:hypothetical protein